MKIVVAPQAFKGTLSASQAADAMISGIHSYSNSIQTYKVPLADGGDGTLEVLSGHLKALPQQSNVMGALGQSHSVPWAIAKEKHLAIIECAKIFGLGSLKLEERNPLKATSFGLGELIKKALDQGIRTFMIGLGGTATNDGGIGMAQALGARILDIYGKDLPLGGKSLGSIHTLDLSQMDARIKDSEFTIACDVANPLLGPNGASRVYGRQKGASEKDIDLLESGLSHLATLWEQKLNFDFSSYPKGGAGGGLGAGCLAFLNGSLEKGFDVICDKTNFKDLLKASDLVITGEGCLDYQTMFSKAPQCVAQIAQNAGVPVAVLAGTLGEGYESIFECGVVAVCATQKSNQESAYKSLELSSKEFIRSLMVSLNSKH